MGRLGAALAGIGLFGAAHAAAAAELGSFSAPATSRPLYSAIGWASWYGAELHGHPTAIGERFDMSSLTAAHKTLPLPCYARVTNLSNGRSIVVRVNDRGPFARGRILDVSARVAKLLDFGGRGVAKVKIEYVGKAAPAGTDEAALVASLRTGAAPTPPVVAAAALAQVASNEGQTVIARFAEPEKPAAPAPAVVAILRASEAAAPPLVAVVPLRAAIAPEEGQKVVANAAEPAKPNDRISPFGSLIVEPFSVQMAGR
jgi:rare lipoprotein A